MKNLKKAFALFLVLALCLGLVPTAFAAETEEDTAPQADAPVEMTGAEFLEMAANSVITLDSDVTLSSASALTEVTSSVEVNLNSHVLAILGNGGFRVKDGAEMTVKNGTINANEISESAKQVFDVQANSSLTMDSVTFNTTGCAILPLGTAATVNVTNSTISAGAYAVSTNAAKVENNGVIITLENSTFTALAPVMLNVNGTLNMTDCTVSGLSHGVIVRCGEATISGGSISMDFDADKMYEVLGCYYKDQDTMMAQLAKNNNLDANWSSGSNLPSAALVVGNKSTVGAYQYAANVTVSNNTTVTGSDGYPAVLTNSNAGTDKGVTLDLGDAVITGSVDNGNNVASVSGKMYTGLQEAVNAAVDGDTVKLLKDVEDGSGVIVNKNLIIDFDNHSYTVTKAPLAGSGEKYATQAFQLLAGNDKANPNTVTMQNGTIVLPSSTAGLQMGIQNYSNLTLNGLTLDASGNDNIAYVLSNNNGNTTITGGTVLKAAEGKVAFDVYDYSSNGYGNVAVTVDNANISGKIEVSNTDKAKLEISGGTFSQKIDSSWCAAGFAPKANDDGTYGVTTEISITASAKEVHTGATVTLTVITGEDVTAPVQITGDGSVNPTETDGVYTVELYNDTQDPKLDVTFTAKVGGSEASCTITVTAHAWGEIERKITKEASCTEAGSCNVIQHCTVEGCKEEIVQEDVEIPAGHKSAFRHEGEEEHLCTEPSSYTEVEYCSVCNTVLNRKEVTVPAHNHEIHSEEIRVKEPTCGATGLKRVIKTCANCVYKETNNNVKIPATGEHTRGEAVEENREEATCKETGSYDEVVYCSVCNKELSREKKTLPVSSEHTSGDPVVENRVEATCTVPGHYDLAVYCSVCNKELSREQQEISAHHTAGAATQENVKAATCTEAGSYDLVVKCSKCGEELSRSENITDEAAPATGHQHTEIRNASEATLTAQGYTGDTYCTDCDTLLEEGRVIPMLTPPAPPSGGGEGGGEGGEEIEDPDVPLAGGADLNRKDHFAYVQGDVDGKIRPNDKITRRETAAMFYRVMTDLARTLYGSDKNDFTDVDSSMWGNHEISTLVNGEILSGYGDGSFRPDANITRAEFAYLAVSFFELDDQVENPFADVKGHWAEKQIAFAHAQGWINGYEDGSFRPEDTITRAEAMQLVNNILGREVDESGILAGARQFSDVSKSDWYYCAVMEAANGHEYERREGDSGVENWTKLLAD